MLKKEGKYKTLKYVADKSALGGKSLTSLEKHIETERECEAEMEAKAVFPFKMEDFDNYTVDRGQFSTTLNPCWRIWFR